MKERDRESLHLNIINFCPFYFWKHSTFLVHHCQFLHFRGNYVFRFLFVVVHQQPMLSSASRYDIRYSFTSFRRRIFLFFLFSFLLQPTLIFRFSSLVSYKETFFPFPIRSPILFLLSSDLFMHGLESCFLFI